VGDSGEAQRLICTAPGRGLRFIRGSQEAEACAAGHTPAMLTEHPPRPALALPDKPSIAVLPFTNIDRDREQEYFADGWSRRSSLP
jgi:DNA-binding winged helix-turn-helix (wHTH) protein